MMVALLAGAMLMTASGIASAYTFDITTGGTFSGNQLTTSVAGATVETFDFDTSGGFTQVWILGWFAISNSKWERVW